MRACASVRAVEQRRIKLIAHLTRILTFLFCATKRDRRRSLIDTTYQREGQSKRAAMTERHKLEAHLMNGKTKRECDKSGLQSAAHTARQNE